MKYLYLVRLLLLCFVIQACDSRNAVSLNKESITQDTGAGKIVLPNTFTNAEENGFTTHQDTLFFNGTKYSGIVYALNNSADTAFVKSYYDGVEEGLQKKWYPNKQIAEIRWYHLGKKTGKHIGFWENGKPKFEFYFLNGEHEGVAKEWYQNGNPYRLFHYEKGYEQGSQKMWWENGTIRANYEVRNGRRYGLIGLKLCMNQNDTLKKKYVTTTSTTTNNNNNTNTNNNSTTTTYTNNTNESRINAKCMFNKIGFLYALIFILFSCTTGKVKLAEKKSAESLPFFNTPDWTPEWISPDNSKYASIHHIPVFNFKDQEGNSITDKTIAGKIYVANFFFTTCRGICPKMTSNMYLLQEAYKENDNILFLSHSVTPKTDSVSVLKKYAIENKVNSKKWHLLTGNENDIYALAKKQYFAGDTVGYYQTGNEFLHTENFILVDKYKRIRGVYNGTLLIEIERIKEDIEILKQEN